MTEDEKPSQQQQKAADLLSDIMGQQLVKSPELAAKQARLLALLGSTIGDANRPETEEDGIRAEALRRLKVRQLSKASEPPVK